MKNRLYPTFTEYLKKIEKPSKQYVQAIEDEVPSAVQASIEEENFDSLSSHEKVTVYYNELELKSQKTKELKKEYGLN